VNRQPGRAGVAEAKYDGARGIARLYDGHVHIQSRPGNNLTTRFPEIAAGLRAAIGRRGAIVDGELVTLSRDGRPNFTRLQRRLRVARASTLLQHEVPARFYLCSTSCTSTATTSPDSPTSSAALRSTSCGYPATARSWCRPYGLTSVAPSSSR
jgi:ATP dependent DNA ligase domain